MRCKRHKKKEIRGPTECKGALEFVTFVGGSRGLPVTASTAPPNATTALYLPLKHHFANQQNTGHHPRPYLDCLRPLHNHGVRVQGLCSESAHQPLDHCVAHLRLVLRRCWGIGRLQREGLKCVAAGAAARVWPGPRGCGGVRGGLWGGFAAAAGPRGSVRPPV